MRDGTRTTARHAHDSAAAATVTAAAEAGIPAPTVADEQLARMFVLMWSLASGRSLRAGIHPDEHSAEELIAFWADDFAPVSGRHARDSANAGAAAIMNTLTAQIGAPRPA